MNVVEGIKPTLNNILVELVKEDNSWLSGPSGKIIKTGKQDDGAEQYCLVKAVGPQITNITPGQYVLTRPNKSYDAFEVEGKVYSFLAEYDIISILNQEVVTYFKSLKAKKINTPVIPDDVN